MVMSGRWARWILLGVLCCSALPLASVWANGAPIHGGPVIIGTDEADDTGDFRDQECRGCGPGNADSSCTNTCVTDLSCEDPARTLFVGGPGAGEGGGSCRQFDDNPADCERAWHRTSEGYPSPCFVCENTNGQCATVGECRGCGGNNLGNDTGCTQTCFTCRDPSRTDFVGSPGEGEGGGSCREHDGSQSACESAWHFDRDGRPTSCFYCTDEEGQCESAGECRGCGPDNRDAGVCEDTCLPCSDSSRTVFANGDGLGDGDDGDSGSKGKGKSRGIGGPVGAPGACRAFDGDPTSCNQAWHLDREGLPASCFFDDRGNIDGYRYIQDGLEALGAKVRNANTLAVCLGCNGDRALEAFERGFDESSLPGQGWTREVLTAIGDLEDFFDNSGAVKIGEAGIIYLPSDDNDNTDVSGITGPAPCRGCGPANDLAGRCENSCTLAAPATCVDGSRTFNAGGPKTRACRQFADQTSCEEAWHTNQFGVPTTCHWNGSECRGCGKNGGACNNTCVPPPTCDDVGRTIALGGPGPGFGCRSISNQTDCEKAWHVTGAFVGVSCTWNGGCVACSPRNEINGFCVNDCGSPLPTPACADGGRTNALGGPQANACRQFDYDPAGCATAWHVTRNGRAASCYMPSNQIAVLNQNALAIGAFVSNGGGFFAHSLRDTPTGYDWLATLLPELLVSRNRCQDLATLTPDGAAAFGVLTDGNLGDVRRLEGGFAGDIGGLAVLGTQPCLQQPLRCTDPARTRFLASRRACRALDGDETACEEGWHFDDDGIPTTCFFCTDDDGACEAAGECRGCGRQGNGAGGVCSNTCIDGDSPLCADKARTALAPPGRGQGGESCLALSGDPGACLAAWHLDRAGNPASCFVCDDADTSGSGRGCDAVGDCRGCGFRNESLRELCDNDCGLGPRVCGDRKRKIFADQNGGCRQFNGNPASCAQAWEFSADAPVSCFVCQGAEGDCDRAGDCETCSASNQRRGACENTCGLPPAGVDRAVIIGGMQVTFAPRLDHFEGYKLKKAPKLPKNCHLALDDSLSTGWDGPIEYTASKVAALLAPADKSEKGGRVAPFPPTIPELDALIDDATHLVAYQIKRKKGQVPSKHQKQRGVLVQNQFGTLRFDTDKEDRFLAPANKDLAAPPSMPSGAIEVDHYKCYKIKVAKNFPGSQQDAKGKFVKRQAIVVDQFESGRPFSCQPGSPKGVGKACKDDKTCGGAKGAFTFCAQTEGHPEFAGARVYDLKKPTRYCVPVAKSTGTDSDCVVTPTGPPKQQDHFLTCYQKKVASKDGLTGKERIVPKQAKHVPRPVFVHSWLAEHQFSTNKEEELCVPSRLMEVNP